MAGNLKTSTFGQFLTFCLRLSAVIHCTVSRNQKDFDLDLQSWFSNFEEVDVFMRRKDTISDGELFFNVSDQTFDFDLRQHSFPNMEENLKVNIDDDLEVPYSANSEGLNIYEGSMLSRSRGYSIVLKLTPDGLDGLISAGNSRFYLEPLSRYISNRGERRSQIRKNLKHDLNMMHFLCIFYKSSDVLVRNKGSNIRWEGRMDIFPKVFAYNESRSTSNYRNKRNTRGSSQTECTLHVVADHFFYQNNGHSDILSTISEMAYLVLQANLIFRGTDFDGDGSGDNIGFHISKVSIYTEPDNYKMATATSVGSYLDLFAEYDFSDYCMATAFSSRDFANGVIGLAWVASSSYLGSAGGICQYRILYNSKKLCLNTNLVTSVNNGRRMPAYLSALTLAHEFGHSFGSPHDETNTVCTPAGDYGNYLMYPYASEGGKPNNDAFSQCSINYMHPVVRNKGTCFKDSVLSYCGNGFREPGEECDCGTSMTCANIDPCCTPSDVSLSDPDHPCTFRRSQGSSCSPRLSHCCTEDCKIVTSAANKVCKSKSDCKAESVCDGVSRECPDQVAVLDSTPCAGGTKSCKNGICSGSICAIIVRSSCTCSNENACYQCCLDNHSVCLPFKSNTTGKLPLSKGASCNAHQGFCDGGGTCISADEASAMDRLNQIFTDGDTDEVKEWFKSHWYYVVLGVLVFIFIIFLFVKSFRSDSHIQTSAYMYGRFTGIQREAELQKAYLERRRDEVETRYNKKIDKLQYLNAKMDFPTAVARMMVFFPTAPMNVIIATLKSSTSEEAAVRWLLLRNYPFRRVCKRIDNSDLKAD